MQQTNDIITTQRIDKWLNIACLFKTRSKASKACDERRVKVNGVVAKPATLVKSGDEITLKSPGGKFVTLQVLAISRRNVSAKDAKSLYKVKELELSEEAKELMEIFAQAITYDKPKYKGRPTKKERRKLEKLKQEKELF
ncbi:RNA-binding S4 domain-containing protein [candidate division KSB1 bacterium]|nr:RNA-binding S4 domain-containing protein [candidate division KSB1 bacterium]RQW00464.1 MAG: RNA-binding S4 domain-containing protein [candidate division KSB1 bacterium]